MGLCESVGVCVFWPFLPLSILLIYSVNDRFQGPNTDSDEVESDAHSLELIECSFVKRVDVVENVVAWDDGRRWRNVFKSKFGWRLACLLHVRAHKWKSKSLKKTLSHCCYLKYKIDLAKLPQMITTHEFLRTNWTAKILLTLVNGNQMESLLMTSGVHFL